MCGHDIGFGFINFSLISWLMRYNLKSNHAQPWDLDVYILYEIIIRIKIQRKCNGQHVKYDYKCTMTFGQGHHASFSAGLQLYDLSSHSNIYDKERKHRKHIELIKG